MFLWNRLYLLLSISEQLDKLALAVCYERPFLNCTTEGSQNMSGNGEGTFVTHDLRIERSEEYQCNIISKAFSDGRLVSWSARSYCIALSFVGVGGLECPRDNQITGSPQLPSISRALAHQPTLGG